MTKENDLFLNLLLNPTFNAFDFKQVGLNVDNTSIEKKDTYKDLDFVKSNPTLQTNGVFDEAKFDAAYKIALANYNQMADNKVSEEIGRHAEFFRDNIFAPAEQRQRGLNFSIERTANPLRDLRSTVRVGEVRENPLSLREIAQTQRVWDEKTQTWLDAPNDSFFANFGDTRVLAQWDEDGEHVDPITGETVEHKKGDKKINDNGTYYYENLNGRSIYGREVLSKFDTLTTDGSGWNKFDVFDSDDKDKNLAGTLFKNALKVVPAFIPGVSPWYIGMRVGLNTVDLLSKLGNMVTNNESDLFHGIEGYMESLGFSTSDYSRGGIAGTVTAQDPNSAKYITPHTWSLENLINMSADVFTQLAEQRWMFKYPPSLIKGKMGRDDKLQEKFVKDIFKKRQDQTARELAGITVAQDGESVGSLLGEAHILNNLYAQNQLKNYMEDYMKIGKFLSMGYMTGVTVADSYGEAIEEGASPTQAALLSLGYALGEYQIIRSDLGKWILPELRLEKARWQLIGKKLSELGLDDKDIVAGDKVKTSNWIKRILHLGKQQADFDYKLASDGTLKLTTKALAANALGEGVEETTEELLYDITKSLYNVLYKLGGSETHLTAFDGIFDDKGSEGLSNLFSRYALSFVGGTIGGGLGEAHASFREASKIKNISAEDAFENLVLIVKEGKADDFMKTVDKTTWASKDLTFDPEGDSFRPVENERIDLSLDAATKKIIANEVKIIKDILNSEGANLSNESLLLKLGGIENPRLEFKALALGHTKMGTKYIQEYNALLTQLVKDKRTLIGLEAQSDKTDSQVSAENAKPEGENVTALRAKIKQEEEALQEYLLEKKTPEFIKKTLFEATNPLISAFKNTTFINYVEGKYKRPISQISDTELEAEREKFKRISELEGGDLVEYVYDVFERANVNAAPILQQYVGKYFDKDTALGIFSREITRGQSIVNLLTDTDENRAIELIKGRYEGEAGDGSNFNPESDPLHFFVSSLITSLKRNGIDVTQAEQDYINLLNDVLAGGVENADIKTRLLDILIPSANSGKQGLFSRADVVDTLLFDIEHAPFINAAQRKELDTILNRVAHSIVQFYGEEDSDVNVEYDKLMLGRIRSIQGAINRNPNYSPILEFIDSFGIATRTDKATQPKVSSVIKAVEQQLQLAGNKNDIEGFGFDEDIEKQIDNALGTIQLVKAVVNAARTDKARFGDIFGYNKTVNQITPNSTLAEIDSNTADTILQEINSVETRLKYYQNIANLNSANKLKEHDKTGVKANTLLFKRFVEKFIDSDNFPPPGWDRDSIDKLKGKFGHGTFGILRGLVDKFNNNGNAMDLSISDLVAYQTEVKEFENAIHEFFEANKANIENTDKLAELLDPATMNTHQLDKNLLNKNAEDIADSGFVWWLASLAAINPNDLRAQYAKTFDEEGKIAPIPGLEIATQIGYAAIMNGKVFGKFAEAYNKALKSYADTMTDAEWDNEFPDRKHLRQVLHYDSDVSIDFTRTILTEGVAGSGKSTGVAEQIFRMIAANEEAAKQLLSNVWFVHTTKDKAYALAERLLGKELAERVKDNCFSHSGLMLNISGTNAAGHTWNETIDFNGNVVIDKDDLIAEEGKPIRYNYDIKKDIKKPSLIITDEVSHLSVPSLKLIDDFAEVAGCSHLVFGDFDQSGVKTKVNLINIVDSNGKVVATTDYHAYAYNTNFIHGFKLGQSLRADNKVKEDNNYILQEALRFIHGHYNDPPSLTFKYVENDLDILLGDKVILPPSSDADFDLLEEYIKKLLKKTIELDPNAKLGYIYDRQFEMEGDQVKVDSNGRPVKEIESKLTLIMRKLNNSEEFKDKIDFKLGNAAQGDENPYYVMDLSRPLGELNWDNYISDFYTGVTRSQRGSLIIKSTNSATLRIDNLQLEKSPKSPITEKATKDFTSKKRKLYQEVYGDEPNPIPYTKYTTSKTRTSNTGGSPTPGQDVDAPEGYLDKGCNIQDGDGKIYEIVQYDLDDKGQYWVILKDLDDNSTKDPIEVEKIKDWPQVTSSPEKTLKNDKNLDYKGDINNSGSDVQMIHHSFNVDETGVIINDDGSITFGEMADGRFDNVIGLYKLIHPGTVPAKIEATDTNGIKEVQFLIEATRRIRSAGRTLKSEQELIDVLKDIFSADPTLLPNNIAVRFIYKSSQPYDRVDKDVLTGAGKEKFLKPDSEQVEHFENGLSKLNTSTISVIYLNKDTGEELVEVPVATDTNPVTLAFTEGFGKDAASGLDITSWVADERRKLLEDASETKKFTKLILNLKKALLDPNLLGKHPQAKKLLEQIRIFEEHLKLIGGRVVFLKTKDEHGNEQWLIPARDWETTGIIINDDENFTMVNDDDIDYAQYRGQWLSYDSLNGRKMVLSKRVYLNSADKVIKKPNGKEIVIKSGSAFVIATDNINKFDLSVEDKVLYDALMDPTRDDGVTIVYIEPPTKSLREYIEQIHSIYNNSDKQTDSKIGSFTTSYKLISGLWNSTEGRQFIEDRIKELYPGSKDTQDKILTALESLVKRFDTVAQNNTGRGDDNKLIEELKKRPKEEISNWNTAKNPDAKLIASTGYTSASTKYSNVFDKLLRTLVQGTNEGGKIKTLDIKSQDVLNRISKIDPIIKDGEDYKYGIFTHIGYKQGEEANKLGTDTHVANIEVGEVRFNGKLDTGVFKTKGERANEYQKQKSDMLTPASDNHDTLCYSGYKGLTMKEFCEDTPTKPKRKPKPPTPPKKSKEDLISNKLTDFISSGQYELSPKAANEISQHMRTLDEKDIPSFDILNDYINKNTESIAHLDLNGTFYFFTMDELKLGLSDNTLKTHDFKYTGNDTIVDSNTGEEYEIVNVNSDPSQNSFELKPKKSGSASGVSLDDSEIVLDVFDSSIIKENAQNTGKPNWLLYLNVFTGTGNIKDGNLGIIESIINKPLGIGITVGDLRLMLTLINDDPNLVSDNIDRRLSGIQKKISRGEIRDNDPVIKILETMKKLLGEVEDNSCNNLLVVINRL